eukprot:CAMPEP_0198130644 /NCGR_PEP_ID=MMETSP1442-20131203/54436_1 /TAXON_ID= /ORGANISM="Craspedostauros australis, Strain CCMP3328" /LENGTH=64 /DNA_ID=CAMNT_0043791313 /DNA_START=166 /DNA_END=360 /DNA_ORIENTATION=-
MSSRCVEERRGKKMEKRAEHDHEPLSSIGDPLFLGSSGGVCMAMKPMPRWGNVHRGSNASASIM